MSPKVSRFEDLVAWQKSRELVAAIYAVTRTAPFCKDFGLCDQMQRAAVSVMSNIAEGFERGSRADFHRFVVIAKASCAEVRSQLYIAFDLGYIEAKQHDDLQALSSELARILGGLRVSLNQNKKEST